MVKFYWYLKQSTINMFKDKEVESKNLKGDILLKIINGLELA